MRRFEIRIHAIAATIDNTTSPSPNALAAVAPDASVLESAINAAPPLVESNAPHPVGRNRSPEKITAATASSMVASAIVGSIRCVRARAESSFTGDYPGATIS